MCARWCRESRDAVGALRSLEGVERLPDGTVPDRVDVDLKALGVEESDHVGELVRLVHPESPAAGGAAVSVQVGLEDGRGEVLHDTVLEDLCAADAEPARRALAPEVDQIGHLLVALVPGPEEVALDPGRQLVAFRQRSVGIERLGHDGMRPGSR